MSNDVSVVEFQQAVLTWFDHHGRKTLPWQQPATAYRVWVSEIMLQQTQVTTVIPYFERFMQTFPTLESLAQADLDQVLQQWSGLGYYARGRSLHRAAQQILALGEFPQTLEGLTALPGIGLSTAGAILSLAFHQSAPILEGNVRRVLARFAGVVGWSGEPKIQRHLWTLSALYTPQQRVADYTQAIMDLGALVCTRSQPRCEACPLNKNCWARNHQQTNLLPTPKPRTFKPVKTVVLLILQTEQQLLLQQRPPRGIWGGLWSLPEFESIEQARQYCSSQKLHITEQKIFSVQRHSFSHYHLDYTPLWISVNPLTESNVVSAANLWYKTEVIFTLALPAPVRQLLSILLNEGIENEPNNSMRKTGSSSRRPRQSTLPGD
jgi:A/G-specific adenine glycosylase